MILVSHNDVVLYLIFIQKDNKTGCYILIFIKGIGLVGPVADVIYGYSERASPDMRQTLYIYIQKGPHWTCGRCYVLIFRKGYSWRWYQLPQTYCQSNVIGQPPTVHVDVVSKHFQNGCLSDYPANFLLAKYRRIQLCLRRSMVQL